jgi:hypothetical protein
VKRLLLGLFIFAALLVAAWFVLNWLGDVSDPNHWKRVSYEFDHSDDWLRKCQPQEVRMQWRQEAGWIDNATINLEAKTISGGSGNGISFSGPFALVMSPRKPQGAELTDDQVRKIKETIVQLSPGKSVDKISPDYSHDFRVAYYKDGALELWHYPVNEVPAPLAQLGRALQLHMPEQEQR